MSIMRGGGILGCYVQISLYVEEKEEDDGWVGGGETFDIRTVDGCHFECSSDKKLCWELVDEWTERC